MGTRKSIENNRWKKTIEKMNALLLLNMAAACPMSWRFQSDHLHSPGAVCKLVMIGVLSPATQPTSESSTVRRQRLIQSFRITTASGTSQNCAKLPSSTITRQINFVSDTVNSSITLTSSSIKSPTCVSHTTYATTV